MTHHHRTPLIEPARPAAHQGLDRGLLAEVAGLIASQLDMNIAFVARTEADGDRSHLVHTHHAGAANQAVGGRHESWPSVLEIAAGEVAAPFAVEDINTEGAGPARELAAVFPGHRSFIVVPVMAADGTAGGLLGAGDVEARSFSDRNIDLVTRAARLLRLDPIASAEAPERRDPYRHLAGAPESEHLAATVSRVLISGLPETIKLDLDESIASQNFEIRVLVDDSGEAATVVRDTVRTANVDTAFATEPELLQTLIDLLPEQIYIKDAECRFVRVNRAVLDDFGVADASAFLGKTDFDLFPEPVARVFYEQEQELLRTGVPLLDVLEQQLKPNNPDHWRRTFKIPIRDLTGQIVGLVGSSWDITAAYEQERAAKWLAALVEWSSDAIVGISMDGNITSWNPAAQKLFGYSTDEIAGQPYFLLVPPGEPYIVLEELLQQPPSAYGRRLETRRRRKNGADVEVEARAAIVRDEFGEPSGISVIMRDIGERKAAEKELRELENRYRSFLENMPALTYMTSPTSEWTGATMLHVGQRFEELVGYPTSNWADDPLFAFSIMHPDDRDRVLALDQETNITGEPYLAEYRVLTADGRTKWLRDEAALVYDDNGKPLYWLGFVLDITDLKQTEAELTEALAGQRAANLELERVNRAKSEIVSVISHEFRTPLTSIQGFSELLVDETLSGDEVRGFAGTINANARRLARMIRDMLDLERLDSGRTEVRRELVDLNEVVDDVIESLRPTAPAHQFKGELDATLPLVVGDTDLLIQVVTNLIGNAIKYSPAETTIAVTTRETADAIELVVADEGLGIPEDSLEAIFSRYTRISRPEQHHIEGTGLGLPIARQIVEMLGGRVWAEQRPGGVGSEFHVTLPKQAA